MGVKDYIILGVVALIAILIVVYLFKKKKKKGSGCGCGCCSGCQKNCRTYINKTDENNKL